MEKTTKARQARVKELHERGLSLREIGRQVGVSHVTVRNDIATFRTTSETVRLAKTEAKALDLTGDVWASLEAEGIESLRQSASAGSVPAARALVAIGEAKADSCRDHIPRDDYENAMLDVFTTVRDCVLQVSDEILFDALRGDLEEKLRDRLDEARLVLNGRYGPEPTAIVEDKAAA